MGLVIAYLITAAFFYGLYRLVKLAFRAPAQLRYTVQNGIPPDPGPLKPEMIRDRRLAEAWLAARVARVNWERAQPRKPIPAPKG